ncbi:MAG: alpha-amylase family glycosyl hydrolase [Chloroflexota bacterium]
MTNYKYPDSPDWLKDLFIYEINTKGFTSPNGPESGTFKSTQEKLPYLADLGINAIWLSGHSLGHDSFFYNIWTQYTVFDPDQIDPGLGTDQDFRDLIEAAHAYGIRVILELVGHGVMKNSPLVEAHPDWFKGESWGMSDYDFEAKNPELDNWWVDLWTKYIVDYGIDGYRVDLGMRRPDLWKRIRENVAKTGKEIVIINELEYEGANEYIRQSGITDIVPIDDFIEVIDFVQRDRYTVLDPHHISWEEDYCKDGRAHEWTIERWEQWLDYALGQQTNDMVPRWAWSSVQLSCHDDGWDGFQGDNPFVAQGSRMIFGYGLCFSGMIPIMMAGEEFDADYTPIPTLSPDLFGGANPGEGKWLYGSMLQWDQLEADRHREMLDDAKKIIAIRNHEIEILGAQPNTTSKHIKRVPFKSNYPTVSPYLRWNNEAAVVIVGNIHTDRDITVTVNLEDLNVQAPLQLTNLLTGETNQHHEQALTVTVPPDKTPGGGLAIMKLH